MTQKVKTSSDSMDKEHIRSIELKLIQASHEGNRKKVRSYLKDENINVDSKDDDGRTPLMKASLEGHIKIVELLLSNGANVNLKDKENKTALSYAQRKSNKLIVELLEPMHFLDLSSCSEDELKKKELDDNLTETEIFEKLGVLDEIKTFSKFNFSNVNPLNIIIETQTTLKKITNNFLTLVSNEENGLKNKINDFEEVYNSVISGYKEELNEVVYKLENDKNQLEDKKEDIELLQVDILDSLDKVKKDKKSIQSEILKMSEVADNAESIFTDIKNDAQKILNQRVKYESSSSSIKYKIEDNTNKINRSEAKKGGMFSSREKHEKIIRDLTEQNRNLWHKYSRQLRKEKDYEKVQNIFDTAINLISLRKENTLGTFNDDASLYFRDSDTGKMEEWDIDEKIANDVDKLLLKTHKYIKKHEAYFSERVGNINILKKMEDREKRLEKNNYEHILQLTSIIEKMLEIEGKKEGKKGDYANKIKQYSNKQTSIKKNIEEKGNFSISLLKDRIESSVDVISKIISEEIVVALKQNTNMFEVGQQKFITNYFNINFPVMFSLVNKNHLMCVYHNEEEKEFYLNLVQDYGVHSLLSTLTGMLKISLIDPIELGKSAKQLLSLIEDKIYTLSTSRPKIEEELQSINTHITYLLKNYLKGNYESIHDYNLESEGTQEASKMLIFYDCLEIMKLDRDNQIESLVKSGIKSGMQGIFFLNANKIREEDKTLIDTWKKNMITLDSSKIYFKNKSLSFLETKNNFDINSSIAIINNEVNELDNIEVSYTSHNFKNNEYWTKDSSKNLRVAIGVSGKSTQYLEINNEGSSHALLIGKPGSGKSVLLHVIITDICNNYSPDMLELYLIDMKGGVEFVRYAEAQLPHAKITAISSERELAYSVLLRLKDMMGERETLFQKYGVNNIGNFNQNVTNEILPRCLLIIDEFQQLFTVEDEIKRESLAIITQIAKQGRAYGINMILASQTLAGDTLPKSTTDQMSVRMVLQCSDDDAKRALSYENNGIKVLSNPGEGIYNDYNGHTEDKNIIFQTFWIEDKDQLSLLNEIRTYADNQGYSQTPHIFREDIKPLIHKSEEFKNLKSRGNKKFIDFIIGEAISFGQELNIRLRRKEEQNLLLCGNSEIQMINTIGNFLVSLSLQCPKESLQLFYVNMIDEDIDEDEVLEGYFNLMKENNYKVTKSNSRKLMNTLELLIKELDERIDGSEYEEDCFLFLIAAHRIKSLRKENNMSSQEAKLLSRLIKEGPENGIFIILHINALKDINNIFDHTLQYKHEFGHIVAYQMTASDSQTLLGNGKIATSLGDDKAIYFNDSKNIQTKFRSFEQIDDALMAEIIK